MAQVPKRAQGDPEPGSGAGSAMVPVKFLVPPSWRDALGQLAQRQRISIADLLRIMVRGFMRERLSDAELAKLDVD